jgi:predicted type IV restriction endonuclease
MIPRRVSDRFVRSIGKYQQILKIAKDRDVNEADTVSIIKDMLADIFGYDKYLEITSEFAIRGTYCDLAVKINNKVEFLIEVKAIGLDLKEGHLRQVCDYGANNGIQWVILTNGILWKVYKIKFEKPISHDEICTFSFDEIDPGNEEYQARLFLICKEGLVKDAREEFHMKILSVNRFILAALLLSDEIIQVIRRELRKLSDGVLVSSEEISKVLTNEVLKRDILEGDDAVREQNRVRRFYGKTIRKQRESPMDKTISGIPKESEKEETPLEEFSGVTKKKAEDKED